MLPLLPLPNAIAKDIPSKNETVRCGHIEHSRWATEKEALFPWCSIDAFNPVSLNDFPEDVRPNYTRFLVCRGGLGCGQIWEVPVAGIASIQTNIKNHMEKVHLSKWNKKIKKEIDGSNTKQSATPYEFVVRWLASGLAKYQVTRDSPSGLFLYLKNKTNCPVGSEKTFDAHRDTFLELTTVNMQKALEGNVVFMVGDSSPDRLKREWINWGLSGISLKTRQFFYMPLGLNQAKGRLTAEAYENHHDLIVEAWGLKERNGFGLRCLAPSNEPIVAGGGADFGPGLSQVYAEKFGTPNLEILDNPLEVEGLVLFAPCASHAIVNIQEAACDLRTEDGDENSPNDYLEELTSLMKLLKRRTTWENVSAALAISFPRTFKSKKWTSRKELFDYLLKHWVKLMSLEGTNLDIFTGVPGYDSDDDVSDANADEEARSWNWTSTFNMLSVFAAVMEPLCSLSVSLQVVGPLDGFVMVMSVLKQLSALHKRDFIIAKLNGNALEFIPLVKMELHPEQQEVYDALEPCICLMETRVVRRFFYNSVGGSIGKSFVGADEFDRTKKYDYLQNTCVLSLFALSSDCEFTFLNSFNGIASTEEILSLAKRSKDALWLMFKCVAGLEGTKRTASVSSTGKIKRLREDFANNSTGEADEATQRLAFFAKVGSLTSNLQLREAIITFDSSDKRCEDRDKLLEKWIKLAMEVSPVLANLLCICGGQMFSNAAGESCFGSLARFLSNSRLRSKGPYLAAQLLACKAKDWAQFDEPFVKRATSARHGPLDAMFKKKQNPATITVGGTTPMEPVELEEEEEEVAITTATLPSTASFQATTTTTTTTTTTEAASPLSSALETQPACSQRANRGSRLGAIIQAIYSRSKGQVSNKPNDEPPESDDEEEDPDY